jgi:phosphosulfolactate synthase (CoM biosynthesis protein A)
MKTYSIVTVSEFWSRKTLKQKVEKILNEATQDGFEVVSISFANWGVLPMAYITLCK